MSKEEVVVRKNSSSWHFITQARGLFSLLRIWGSRRLCSFFFSFEICQAFLFAAGHAIRDPQLAAGGLERRQLQDAFLANDSLVSLSRERERDRQRGEQKTEMKLFFMSLISLHAE